jgi:hypothetical protein
VKIAPVAYCLLVLPAFAGTAHAVEVGSVAGEPITVDVTNTAIVNYHFDNRNSADFNPRTKVDDNYGEWLDRLNVQANGWRFRLGFRLDVATFFHRMTRQEARAAADEEVSAAEEKWEPGLPPPPSRTDTANRFYRERQSRFLNTFYPAKLWVGYTQPGLDVTAGDFYAQLGRGFVLSLRKIDELAVDTTVRGVKVAADHKFGPVRLAATLLGGQMNPVRVDEASGRRLHSESSPLFFAFPQQGDLVTYNLVGYGTPVRNVEHARPSYLTDTVIGGRVEGGVDFVQLAVNGSMLLRKSYTEENLACKSSCPADPPDERNRCLSECGATYPDYSSLSAAQNHNHIRTFSASVTLPNIADHGDFYMEVAGQQLRDGRVTALGQGGKPPERQADLSGYAIYLNANGRKGPVTVSLEGKHYRKFFPLAANIDTSTPGFGAPEYAGLSYNQPPTVEPIYVEPIESPNGCMTGGWGRTDYRFTREASVYAWLGYYVSHSEIQTNDTCETGPEHRTNTWDTAVGTDLDFEKGRSKVRTWIGARVTTREEPIETARGDYSDAFYQEGYIRYDITKHLTGPFSLQLQGFHRRRYQVYKEDVEPWHEGENYTALQWSPHFSAIFGYEYIVKKSELTEENAKALHYFSGGLQYRSTGDSIWSQIFDTISVFVGQRRGGTRCVSGVCRLFPPFEGAKFELVSRF